MVSPDKIYGQEEFYRAMREMLDRKGPINPLLCTMKDSAVLYGVIAAASTACMFLSGYMDSLQIGAVAEHNYLRMAQGLVASANVLMTAGLSAVGRYQTYSDLADFQQGKPIADIIGRADTSRKSRLQKAFDWTLKNAFNINAVVSLPLCGVMLTSGIMSGRPGEALTAALLLPVYIAQLFPERYGSKVAAKPVKGRLSRFLQAGESLVQRIPVVRTMPPLLLSSLLASWRLVPMAINAVAERDLFQSGQFGLSLLMYVFKANTTKDGIGRLGGSIISPDTKNALAITDALLNGRLRNYFRVTKKPAP